MSTHGDDLSVFVPPMTTATQLTGNRIGDEGMSVVVWMLNVHVPLTTLYLLCEQDNTRRQCE